MDLNRIEQKSSEEQHAITTRGLKEAECEQIAQLIDAALSHAFDESELKRIRFQVNGMMRLRPLFAW